MTLPPPEGRIVMQNDGAAQLRGGNFAIGPLLDVVVASPLSVRSRSLGVHDDDDSYATGFSP